jgi:hypothetical protein
MTAWTPDNQKIPWNKTDPEEQRRRVAWSVATSCAIETGESPVDIYERMLKKFQDVDAYGHMALDESNESS